MPSIYSDTGGSAFLVGDGRLAVPTDDDTALLDAMRRLCDPRSLATAMGARDGADRSCSPGTQSRHDCCAPSAANHNCRSPAETRISLDLS